ncbi:efflux RND transporter periplasmic adaptor subunit [Pontibacter sp. Tf4]|uniref:efflux RND transporter periplasmic adaptor subunit n=1 Tax=Pontibacter sp. Tf4 TaxID=2761620 RepID=UPI001626541E|nr:efflux RND transporter periplasmic adaptor subunit [Pontibacter sp. Tf4]MBB6611666.1 efflux RND transporter periplasmic adaptor subunit [Pontibacter sp. Tf4]
MKRYINILLLVLAIVVAACSGDEHKHAEGTTYTCPMHPQIVQNEPGTCPICGMDLVPQNAHSEGIEITEDLAFLLKPTNTTVVATIATIKPEHKSVDATIAMEGIISYDPNRVYTIPARVAGRIESLQVKFNFQPVRKGQKLMEIYSPDLITAQRELTYLVRSAPEDKQLIEAAKQKLRLLGATDAQINQLVKTGKESYTFAIYSPYDGYVIGLNTTAPTASAAQTMAAAPAASGMDGMGGGASTTPAAPQTTASTGSEIQLREGMYVSTGQALLQVVNPNRLWAEFNIAADKAKTLTKGAPVQITFPQLPDQQLQAKLDFLQPFYQAGENFAKVRVYLPGEQKAAMVGQLVSGKVNYTTEPTLWIPKEAVLDIGTKTIVFKKGERGFEPMEVTTGTTQGKEIQVSKGLQQTDVIAANAQFLVDSESFIRVNK